MEVWCEDVKTKECWKLTRDKTKPVYYNEDGTTEINLSDISRYRFYPVCPKDAPVNEVVEENPHQMTIFDFLG